MNLLCQIPSKNLSVFEINGTVVIISENDKVDVPSLYRGMAALSISSVIFNGDDDISAVLKLLQEAPVIVIDPEHQSFKPLIDLIENGQA